MFGFGEHASDEATAPYNYYHLNLKNLVQKLHHLVTTSSPPFELSDVRAIVDAIKHQGNIGIDDRLLLLEKLLHAMSVLDQHEQTKILSQEIQHFVIGILYKDLPHPQSGFLSPVPDPSTVKALAGDRKYAYRPADGSNYNPLVPAFGKAHHPYARSVPAAHVTSPWALPDAGLVFDTLLKRDKFEPHPGGISSLFFAFADLIIHDIFNTSVRDPSINEASSYLDLSPLYGSSEAQVDSVRKRDGTGKLWNDVFADARLLNMPPAACALLILLCRNHNYIAEKILDINEFNRYENPPSTPERSKAQDDEIFERARLVNCGYFMHIILGDYVGAILGLVRDGSSWRLDPLMPVRNVQNDILPRGEGNVVSVEFNLLYTWHASLSQQDTKWITDRFSNVFPGIDLHALKKEDFIRALPSLMPRGRPKEWTFGRLKRKESGFFEDAELAQVLQDAIEWRASAFKARGIPEALRVVELMNIEKSRKWGMCTLNEFRKFLGLKGKGFDQSQIIIVDMNISLPEYQSFEEWNNKKEIAAAAETLYQHIDNLELYVGLQAEQAKEPGPGAGLCPGYTISRSILSDAVCLTRGDRFLTVDYTPANLTSWGFQDCQYDPKDGSYGGLLTKLLYRTLPDYFPPGSAYAHFPFLVPSWMQEQMTKESKEDIVSQYSWSRPRASPPPVAAITYQEVRQILNDPSSFVSGSVDRLYSIFGNSDQAEEFTNSIQTTSKKLFEGEVSGYFTQKTRELIVKHSLSIEGGSRKRVDIIKAVINELPTTWFSDTSGVKLPADIDFADVGRYIYINDDPANDWHMHLSGREFADRVRREHPLLGARAVHAVAAAIPTAPYFSKALGHIVDYYLSDDKQKDRENIVKLAKEGNTAGVMGFIKRALRRHPVLPGFYVTSMKDKSVGIKVQSTQRVYVSITEANSDPSIFRDDTDVSADSPVIFGFENKGFFTPQFFEEAVPAVLKVIFELGRVQCTEEESRRCHRFTEYVMGTRKEQYINRRGQVTPWPESMILEYDTRRASL